MIRILWRSAQCLAVFKPAGLSTQAPAPHDSLEHRLRAQLGEPHGGQAPYVALPHRLDRAVSGVILVALSKRAAGLLSQQFETRKVGKVYLAWVQGQVNEDGDHARWTDRLRKTPDQPQAEVVPVDGPSGQTPPGQHAETHWRVLRRQAQGTLLELCPVTGRMHQLRVQCAHRGHPIIGDALYGSSESWSYDSEAVGTGTIALHAWKIRFHDPRNGRSVAVEAPPSWAAEWLP